MSRLDWRQVITPAVYIVLMGIALVFLHTGAEGERGLSALREAKAEKTSLEAEMARVTAQKAELENRVRRLRETYLDLDLLDERARAVLGYVRPDEVVIRP